MWTRTRQAIGWGAGLWVASVALVAVAWVTRGAARELVDAVVDPLYLPALAAALVLSPNPHDVNGVFLFGAYVVQTFLMLVALAALGARFKRAQRPKA